MLAWHWSPEMRSASASSSAANPVFLSVFLAAFSRSSARYGDFGDGADAALKSLLRDADRDVPLDGALDLAGLVGALDLDRRRSARRRPTAATSRGSLPARRSRRRCRGRTPAGPSASSGSAGFVMMTLSAFSMPMRLGSSHAPPQPGMMPSETSGSAIAATERVDSAVGRVQPDLDSTAEGEPVPERERRHAEL